MRLGKAMGAAVLVGIAALTNGQFVDSRVKVEFKPGRQAEGLLKVSPLVKLPNTTQAATWLIFREGVTYRQVDDLLKSSDHVASYRFGIPSPPDIRPGKGGRERIKAIKEELKREHADFLSVLSEEDRKRTRQRPERMGWIEAREWFMERRGMLDRDMDYAALYRKAVADAEAMPTEEGLGGKWTELGPKSAETPDTGWSGFGPFAVAGRVNCIAYAPSNASIVYAGTAGGGLWKSTDAGNTWRPEGDRWASLNIGAIAIHPTNPNIVLVGTGDQVGLVEQSAGLYRTFDGGGIWTRASGTSTWEPVTDIEIDPDDPSIVLATTASSSGAYGTIYRSTNQGGTFSLTGANGYKLIWQRGLFGGSQYLAVGSSFISRSTDRGQSWSPVTVPFIRTGHVDIAASTVSSARAFYVNGTTQEVWETSDYGQTWSEITGNLAQAGVWDQAGTYNLHITATETDRGNGPVDVIYVGTLDLYRFVKPNTGWTMIGDVYGPAFNARFHTDQHAMAIHPTASNIGIIANDGGLFRISLNPTTLTTGVAGLNGTFGSLQFYGAAFHPSDKFEFLAGAQDNGTIFQANRTDPARIVTGGDGIPPVIKQDQPLTQFSRSQNMGQYEDGTFVLRRTQDGWVTKDVSAARQAVLGEFPFIPVMKSPEATPNNVFVLGKGLYRYTISLDTWTARLGGQDFGEKGTDMEVAPSASGRYYVTTPTKLWTSSNSGSTWVDVTATAPRPTDFNIASIDVHPTTSTSVLVTGSHWYWLFADANGVYEIPNILFPAWVNRSGNLPNVPVNDIVRDPSDPTNTWFVATDVGVFRTTDRGATWTNFGGGQLPNCIVMELDYKEDQNMLYATTFGRGIWRYGFNETVPATGVSGAGSTVLGSLSSIQTADLNEFRVQPYGALHPRIAERGTGSITIDFGLPVRNPSKVNLNHRASMAASNVRTEVQIYNYALKRWEVLSTYRSSLPPIDRVSIKDGGDELEDYVSVVQTMRFRFKSQIESAKTSGFQLGLDFVSLLVEP